MRIAIFTVLVLGFMALGVSCGSDSDKDGAGGDGGGGDEAGAEEAARKVVQAKIDDDWSLFISLVAPERRSDAEYNREAIMGDIDADCKIAYISAEPYTGPGPSHDEYANIEVRFEEMCSHYGLKQQCGTSFKLQKVEGKWYWLVGNAWRDC